MSLSDFESTIYSYIAARLKEEFPELGVNPGDPLADLFINPMISTLKPFVDGVNRVDLVQDLSNAELMTDEELDVIGKNNYGIEREAGSRASGYVYVEMDFNVVNGLTAIGPLVVSNSSGLRYMSNDVTIIKYTEDDVIQFSGTVVPGLAADYLNPSTGKYEFPVYVEAEVAGPEYNVEIGEINTLETKYPLLNETVTNKEPFSNGVAKESNIDYAERLKRNFFTKHLGVSQGYRSYVLNNFDVVRDVYVSGYGDPLMNRDTILTRENGITTEKHIGGKVDLYLKGYTHDTHDQFIYINSDRVRLEYPLLKSESAVAVVNITNPDINDLKVNIFYENEDTKLGWVDVQVVPGDSGVPPITGDEIEIRYISYVDDTYTDTLLHSQTLYYNSNRVRVNRPPFDRVVAVFNESTEEEVSTECISGVERVFPVIERGFCPDQSGLDADHIKLDPTQAVSIDDYYVGGEIKLIDGTGGGQSRVIVAYNKFTQICTVDSPWETNPDGTTEYKIRSAVNNREKSSKDTIDLILDTSFTSGDPPEPVFYEGNLVRVSYVYNDTVYSVQEDIDFTENRIITTDVLVREATPVYLYLGMKVKCHKGKTITTSEKTIIQALVEEFIAAVNFNSDLQLSDIIGRMYREYSITDFMDFIEVPVVYFVSKDPLSFTEDTLLSLEGPEFHLSNVSFVNDEYPVLGMLAVKAAN